MKLGYFTIEDLGVEHPDYFPGYSTGIYNHCCYGVGRTEAEALVDCLMSLDDFTSEEFKRIEDEYGPTDDETTSLEVADGNPEFPPLFHIGIRYDFLEENRFSRILKIKSLEPLRYESYCATQGYVIKVNGSARYGDFKSNDWPESAEAYFTNLRESGELYFYVPYSTGSDYSGSTVTRANYLYIEEEYGEDWVHIVYGGYDTYAIAVGLTGLLQSDRFDEFCEILEGLEDYPLIDDEALYQLEMEAADEAWECWVEDAFKSSLEEKFEDYEFEWPDDLRTFFEEKREESNTYWECEGYGPDMYINVNKVIEEITFDDIEN